MPIGRHGLAPIVIAVAAAASVTAAAQSPGPPQPPPASPQQAPAKPPTFITGWNDGFFVQSPDGDNRLQLGAILQVDGRFSLDDPAPITNTFVLRKARPVLTGRVARYFDFKLMPDFAGGSPTLLDAYLDIRFSTKLRVRSGKDKTPVGYELLIGDASLIFPERTLASILVPNRDVGFQAIGDLLGGKLLYSAGVFNGQVDGTSNVTDLDTNAGKDLAGRVVVFPFRSTNATASPFLSNLGFHLGGSTGSQTGALPLFRTSAGQTYFGYVTGAAADGRRNRVTPAVFLYAKSFGAFAEYTRSTQDVLRSGASTTITNQAWGVTASYVLTGEATSERGVRPRTPFDPTAGHWGALQVAARYATLTVDDDAFAAGLAIANASREARQWTAAANWYPSNYIKVYATFERTTFLGARPRENIVLFRTQLAF